MNIVVRTYAYFEETYCELTKLLEFLQTLARELYTEGGQQKFIYNLWWLALDVLVELHRYKAKNEKELYKGAYNMIGLRNLLHEILMLNSVVHSTHFNHSKYVALKIKDAIDQVAW